MKLPETWPENGARIDSGRHAHDARHMNIRSERLAHWFFRLNGFLTISNFVVHVDEGVGQHTDVDVLGVRFPHRAENQVRPMPDHPLFAGNARMQVVLAETKRTLCRLNRAWTEPGRGNLERVLSAAGFYAPAQMPAVAAALYERGFWADLGSSARLVAVGEEHNRDLARRYPNVEQLFWRTDVLPFIHERFWAYRHEKRMHPQWDADAHALFNTVMECGGDLAAFMAQVDIDGE
ncbi:hypothetical protein RAMLITH_22590 [Ramlibacter sp. RBP-2]|uniref:Uncharacterized protein n=1 Tax=Ramlibacter lithotrophicus TaxID=2606681 RepID=A0A7X6DKD2_9BURK|nr:hypothetical protein [Ramlibacter lithotrophicus]NKE68613.1 hypothetical protein [Ramlibacter lithotrophicus]